MGLDHRTLFYIPQVMSDQKEEVMLSSTNSNEALVKFGGKTLHSNVPMFERCYARDFGCLNNVNILAQ
jgi:hypothetical protein